MNIGSLYTVKKYFWLIFPTKEIATSWYRRGPRITNSTPPDTATAAAVIAAAYWSKQYNCEVTYFSPESFIVFLQEDGKLKKVLTSDGRIGWTWFDESYNECFEEVKANP